MKRALVTGGNGFIGSNLVDKLIEQGWQVTVIDDNSAEHNNEFYYNDKASNYKLNICDYDKIEHLFKDIEVVFHLAAESRIQPAILNPCYAAKVNTFGTCNVLQAARVNKVSRVIYSSTSAAYGLKNKSPLKESMENDCLNPYSVTKTSGEELCKMYSDLFGLKTITFRYFNVYGERQPTKGQYAPVVGLFLRQSAAKKPMTIVGDGLQRRDFTHVDDVVSANILAATTENELAFGEIFNVGTGKNHSILEIAKFIGGDFVHIEKRPGESRETLADNSKIKKYLGWEPTVGFFDWLGAQR